MQIINLSSTTQRFIISASAYGIISTDATMELYSDFNKKNYSILMVANSSLFSDRYNEFIFPSETFIDLIPGTYNYKIVDGPVVYNVGMLKIIENELTVDEQVDEQYISITPNESQDDYVVFG